MDDGASWDNISVNVSNMSDHVGTFQTDEAHNGLQALAQFQ